MVGLRETVALRTNTGPNGSQMSAREREDIIKPYLPSDTPHSPSPARIPAPPARKPSARRRRVRSRSVKAFLVDQFHALIYTLVTALFAIYRRCRQAWHAVIDRIFAILYYHHRAPELIRKDVSRLTKLPQHLSVILDYQEDEQSGAGLEGLVNDISEIAAWCASAGIPLLSVYERTGVLKNYMPQTHRCITRTLNVYFPVHLKPTLSLRAPHYPAFEPPPSAPPTPTDSPSPSAPAANEHLTILLLSADDGRGTLVDLTKTLAEMAQRGKISPDDISAELVDAEISEGVMGEPELLILFGPRVVLDGYPPWQIRLTEIFHVPDNTSVGYQVFLRALHKYAKAQLRFGR